jgi:hypothetical protein
MKKVALLLSFVLAISVSGCSKSAEEISLENRMSAFNILDEQRQTWDQLGQIDVYECNIEILKNRLFQRWSWDADSCSKTIQEVLSPLKILETEFSGVEEKWPLIDETQDSLKKLSGLQYCSERNFEDQVCETSIDQVKELYNLSELIERWYSWKATV